MAASFGVRRVLRDSGITDEVDDAVIDYYADRIASSAGEGTLSSLSDLMEILGPLFDQYLTLCETRTDEIVRQVWSSLCSAGHVSAVSSPSRPVADSKPSLESPSQQQSASSRTIAPLKKLEAPVRILDELTETPASLTLDAVRPDQSTADYRPTRDEIEADMERILYESDSKREFEWSSKGTAACELCQRVMPLTRHHLIPRMTHSK